jgi:ABC-type antimicrobial peptide transport system permease subunit
MKGSKLFSLEGLSRREIILVLVCCLIFLLLQGIVVGLIPAQIVMVALFLLLYFAHDYTRKMAVALLPFIAFEISYDWMRLYPNYLVNEVDTQAIY